MYNNYVPTAIESRKKETEAARTSKEEKKKRYRILIWQLKIVQLPSGVRDWSSFEVAVFKYMNELLWQSMLPLQQNSG